MTIALIPGFLRLPRRPPAITLIGRALMISLLVSCVLPSVSIAQSQSPAERGRLVYLSKGCTRCHSQKLRQSAADVVNAQPPGSLGNQQPPATKNSREGPDLSEVGARRSTLWLKMHLYDPREVSGVSIMPSYTLLFRGQKGNYLVAYLASLHSGANSHTAEEQAWHLSDQAVNAADPAEGLALYNRYCATCHNASGRTRLRWQSEFIESPAILRAGAMQAGQDTINHLSQIIKFGISDSDMAGHEGLPDKDIASLSAWLTQKTPPPARKQ